MPISNGNITNGGGSGGGGGDGGAISLVVTSPNSSVTQVGQSTYNPRTRQIAIALQAVGGGTVADYTKYNYPITCDNTPTFAAGEEYLLTTTFIKNEVYYSLNFSGATAPDVGTVTIDFVLNFAYVSSYNTVKIKILQVTSSGAKTITNDQVLSLFSFKSYYLATPVTINGGSVSGVVVTIILNSTLPFSAATTKSVIGTVSSNNIYNYTQGLNPNNPALLAVTNGILTNSSDVLTDSSDELGVGASIAPSYSLFSDVATMTTNVLPIWKDGVLTTSNLSYLNVIKKYVKYFFVDPDNGVDANTTVNNGSMNAPFKTVAYALTIASTGTSIVLLGKSAEAAFTITKANMDIMTLGTRSALAGFTNKVTVNNTVAGSSIRFSGLSFDGGLEPATTNVGGIYLYNGQTTAAFVKNDAGYLEMVGFDCSNNTVTLNKGTTVINNGKTLAPTITGVGTQVTLDNVGLVLGNASVGAGAVLAAFETNWVAAATGAAVSGAVGSFIYLDGINFARADGTRANISLLGSYDFQHCDCADTGNAFGTLIGVPDNFTRIRLWQAPVITTATQMYVKDPTTGEMCLQNISSTPAPAGSFLQIWDFASDITVTNGNVSFAGGKTLQGGTDITYDANTAQYDIKLAAGNTYKYTLAFNAITTGQPTAQFTTYDISGSSFTSSNVTVTAGSITSNVYTCTGTSGSAQFANAVNPQGAMKVFTPKTVIYPSQMAIASASTATSLLTYTQTATTGVQATLVKSSAISSQSLTRDVSIGSFFGNNNAAFDHPFNGSNPGEFISCGNVDRSIVSDSLSATRFAYSTNGGISYTTQTTPLANSVEMTSPLTACFASDINRAVFIGSSGVSCRVDLTAGTFTQFSVTNQGVKQCVRGNLGGVMNFVIVGNNNTWNQFQKSTDGSSWLVIASNNLPSILPTTGTVTPVYSMGGICQTKDSLKAWIVAVNDTANNITYLCSSADLISFSSLNATATTMLANANTPELLALKAKLPTNLSATIQAYSGFNVNGLFCELISGVGLAAGACGIMMYSTNTNGTNNRAVCNSGFWATPEDWRTVNNPAGITGSQRGFMYPNGVFAIWQSGGTFDATSTADGGNTWVYKGSYTSFTQLMALNDYQICSCSTVSASRKHSATYRNKYTTTALYSAVWIGGQQLLAGTSSTSTVTLTAQTVSNYSYSDTNGALLMTGAVITPSASNGYLSVGVSGINKGEKVSGLSGTAYVVQNTFLVTATGVNCVVGSPTQAPGVQGNSQNGLFGVITNVTANAVLRIRCDYNNGSNRLGGGNNILIEKK